MEAIGGACSTMDGEWESICRILCMDQDPDFTTLLGQSCSSTDDRHISAASFSSSLDFDPLDVKPDGLQRQAEVPLPAPKKRARLPNDVSNRKWQAKKSRKEEKSDCYVADNSNEISDGSKETLTTSNSVRKRSDRRTATDPQSLYARRRRERINERLRTLQTLVPNGAKVDISTMLEEAVHYVKFLQLQIKLLSSDEHWMYAPLAYNGFDVGQNYNMFSPYLLS